MMIHSFIFRASACLLVLSMAWNLSCKPKAGQEPGPNEPATSETDTRTTEPDANVTDPKTTVKKPENDIAVTVNGFAITEAAIEELVKPTLEMMAKSGRQLPPQFLEQYKQNLRQQTLNRLIVEYLLDEKVKEANITVTDQEVSDQILEIAATQTPPLTLEQFKEKVESYGQSFDDVLGQIKKQLTYQKMMEPLWAGKIDVNEADAKEFYEQNSQRYNTPEQVRASHILVTPDPNNADPNQAKAEALAEANDLLKQAKDGADFAELAKAHSDGPSGPQGGDLDYFPRGKMVPPFDKAAFELEVGQISDIVETQFGYHIIKLTDRKEPSVTSFEEAKEGIMKNLTAKKQSEFAREYIDSLRADATITYPPGKEPKASMPPGGVRPPGQ